MFTFLRRLRPLSWKWWPDSSLRHIYKGAIFHFLLRARRKLSLGYKKYNFYLKSIENVPESSQIKSSARKLL
jgi:hypothetical protein